MISAVLGAPHPVPAPPHTESTFPMPPRALNTFRLPRRALPSVVLATLLLTVTGIQLARPAVPLAAPAPQAARTVAGDREHADGGAGPVRAAGESVMQIVSHPDDDLFF